MITIVDYGMGNLRSIQNMLKHLGVASEITSDKEIIGNAESLILPGVGAFDKATARINELGLRDVIISKANQDKIPILGICLGMQLLGNSSEEGHSRGLGLVDAQSVRFEFGDREKQLNVPHMGWNTVFANNDHSLFRNMAAEPRFYFVHSYHVVCADKDEILGTTDYGGSFTSAIARDNIMGVQFHPEKSHTFGMALLKNFAESYQYA